MTIAINIAKALLAVIKTNNGNLNLDRVQVSAGSLDHPGPGRLIRYVATNGHVLLVVELEEDNVSEGTEDYSLADLKEYVASKGYSTLTDRSADYGDFPDWEQCMPSTTSPVETIGLSVKYLKMLADIGRFLQVGDTWKVSLDGPLSPTMWEPQDLGDFTRVSFIIMPIRLD